MDFRAVRDNGVLARLAGPCLAQAPPRHRPLVHTRQRASVIACGLHRSWPLLLPKETIMNCMYLGSIVVAGLYAAASSLGIDTQTRLHPMPADESEWVRQSSAPAFVTFTFEGFVLTPDGIPAERAVVVSSAGGQAVADSAGVFRLEAKVAHGATRLQITAVGGEGGNLLASRDLDLNTSSRQMWVGPLYLARSSHCVRSWLPTFGQQPGANDSVRALTVFDDGDGAALYAAGLFTSVGDTAANRIAKWDGARWHPLGIGFENLGARVLTLAVFDDGSGDALYAGGDFYRAGNVSVSDIAKWDGTEWSAVGAGVQGTVKSLAVYDDGGGEALYAGGAFMSASGLSAHRVAKWDGLEWSALGSGLNAFVNTLLVHDDGAGEALYVAGNFTTAGGVTASRIAKWDGMGWSPLGSGMDGTVNALEVFDVGGGPTFIAGGNFSTAGGVAANNIARWDGLSWAPLGAGLNDRVLALTVLRGSGADLLYVGGDFTTAGGMSANRIASWDGSDWTSLGAGVNATVWSLNVFDRGDGAQLLAGGDFTTADGTANFLGLWAGSDWSAIGDGLDGRVRALTVFDDGNGEAVYAGGDFLALGSTPTKFLAKWNGATWSAFSVELDGPVHALTVYDDGQGPALYAGGVFTSAGSVALNSIAKWDGSSWIALGGGVTGGPGAVNELGVFDDGTGGALYAGGSFVAAGGVPASSIARWDGSNWSALGRGVSGSSGLGSVHALAVLDDGSGPALYVGGSFMDAGGIVARNIARWDGTNWMALGRGVNASVGALAVFDDGGGDELYVGGSFGTAGVYTALRIAKWNGSTWVVGAGMDDSVSDLIVFDDGAGEALFAGGEFTIAGGVVANKVARWDGSVWTALGSGMSGSPTTGVSALAVLGKRDRAVLYAGGSFAGAIDSGDSFLARWSCEPAPAHDESDPYVETR